MRLPLYKSMRIPKDFIRGAQSPDTKAAQSNTVDIPQSDITIFWLSLFIREFASTLSILVLNSRLGKDNFLVGPIVTLYINLVFRRPLNNPFVLTMACMSRGDWGKANVAGYPGLNSNTTTFYLFIFWVWMLVGQLSGAVAAAFFRAHNDAIFGSEFIDGAAWGSGQIYLKANTSNPNSCWNSVNQDNVTQIIQNIPIRLLESQTTMLRGEYTLYVQMLWWFSEDLVAVLFLIVGYIHIWRWLRWEDMKDKAANELQERYWRNLIAFSSASASLGLMTAMTFPTAHYGAHTSVFLSVYQSLKQEKAVTANFLHEPLIRAGGGTLGCLFAVLYEKAVTALESADPQSTFYNVLHKVLYLSKLPERKESE